MTSCVRHRALIRVTALINLGYLGLVTVMLYGKTSNAPAAITDVDEFIVSLDVWMPLKSC